MAHADHVQKTTHTNTVYAAGKRSSSSRMAEKTNLNRLAYFTAVVDTGTCQRPRSWVFATRC